MMATTAAAATAVIKLCLANTRRQFMPAAVKMLHGRQYAMAIASQPLLK
jgi:hypothetical protein